QDRRRCEQPVPDPERGLEQEVELRQREPAIAKLRIMRRGHIALRRKYRITETRPLIRHQHDSTDRNSDRKSAKVRQIPFIAGVPFCQRISADRSNNDKAAIIQNDRPARTKPCQKIERTTFSRSHRPPQEHERKQRKISSEHVLIQLRRSKEDRCRKSI